MSDWHLILAIAGGLLAFASIIPYVYDILRGTTRPNVVSYALWAVLLFVAILGQLTSGASWSLVFVLGNLGAMIIVIGFCLAGYGYKKYGKTEWICGILAIFAVIAWQATNEPLYVIVFAFVADFFATIPTIVKTYREPKSELPLGWAMVACGALLGIIASTKFDLANMLFPVWALIVNSTVTVLALRGKSI